MLRTAVYFVVLPTLAGREIAGEVVGVPAVVDGLVNVVDDEPLSAYSGVPAFGLAALEEEVLAVVGRVNPEVLFAGADRTERVVALGKTHRTADSQQLKFYGAE